MSIIKRNANLFPAVPTLFDDFFSRDFFNWNNNIATVPAVNIHETNEGFEVQMAAPGMHKEDFKITLEGNMLNISSSMEDKKNQRGNNGNYNRMEFSYQAFQRSFELPKDVVDESKIEAQYENGLLKVSIPKKEEVKQKAPKLIEIA